jgi:hypothetical protein
MAPRKRKTNPSGVFLTGSFPDKESLQRGVADASRLVSRAASPRYTRRVIDLEYLRRVRDREDLTALMHDGQFLDAQKLFFEVVEELGGSVDFDIADMHEVHAVAALAGSAKGLKVLDLGCGSSEDYVLEDTFRDRYPPFFAEMLVRLGATVTGVDIRPQANAGYDHRVLDLTELAWVGAVSGPYEVISCFSLFNAPESPFEHDAALCDRIMDDMRGLLAPEGVVVVNLRDELFAESSNEAGAKAYIESRGFDLSHIDGNCAWIRPR